MPNKYHYDAWISKEDLQRIYYIDNLSQIEIAQRYFCLLKKVQQTLKRFGIKPKRQIKRNQFGENNDSWKGIKAGYKALHYRVNNLLGKPRLCEVCGSKDAKRYEWANLTGDYANPKDYKRMCKSCHSKHDNVIKNIIGGEPTLCKQ